MSAFLFVAMGYSLATASCLYTAGGLLRNEGSQGQLTTTSVNIKTIENARSY